MDTHSDVLKITDLSVQLKTKHGLLTPLDRISIRIPSGSAVGLVGESGCGKSMTALAIMGILPSSAFVSSGEILLNGNDLVHYSNSEMRKIRGDRISMIFQEPMTSLNPVIRVGKQVREGILLHQDVGREEAKNMVIDIFRKVGIPEPERRYNSYPHELSGGLRQRVMIGMAMVCQPDLLIADEPTTALDVTIEAQILYLMRQLRQENNTSILMITHNLGVVSELCDYVYVMYTGQIVESCPVTELFRNPLHPYTQALLRAIPTIRSQDRLENIPGSVPPLDLLPAGCRLQPRCQQFSEHCRFTCPPLIEVSDNHYVRCWQRTQEEIR